MYVCMYVMSLCMNVCIHVCALCMHSWMNVCLYSCMNICMCQCMYTCMCVCIHQCMYVCMYVCIESMYICVCMYVCVCTVQLSWLNYYEMVMLGFCSVMLGYLSEKSFASAARAGWVVDVYGGMEVLIQIIFMC